MAGTWGPHDRNGQCAKPGSKRLHKRSLTALSFVPDGRRSPVRAANAPDGRPRAGRHRRWSR
jgi:hypothetical protein